MKKKLLALAFATLLAFVLAGCGGETAAEPTPTATPMPTATPEPEPEEKETINVDFDVTVGGDPGNPEFQITTNLPDETELMLTLEGDNDFTAQTKVTIENGAATSEPLSNKGEPLSGAYSLRISMSLPSLQSDYVRSVIGEKGEYIDGPYVEDTEITDANVVSATFEFEF